MEVVISHIIQEDNALWVCDVPIEEGCLSKSHIYIFDRLFFRHPLCLPCSPLFPLLLSLFIHLGLRVHQFFLSLICFISLPSQLHHISGSFQSQLCGFFSASRCPYFYSCLLLLWLWSSLLSLSEQPLLRFIFIPASSLFSSHWATLQAPFLCLWSLFTFLTAFETGVKRRSSEIDELVQRPPMQIQFQMTRVQIV